MRVLLPLVLGGLIFLLCMPASAADKPDASTRMRLAAQHLVHTQLPSGLFIYEPGSDSTMTAIPAGLEGVSMVRQSVAAFTLSVYATRFNDRPALDAVKRYLASAVGHSVPIGKGRLQSVLEWAGVYNRWRLWTVLREPLNRAGLLYAENGPGLVLSPDGSYEQVYPGATALALAAGLNYQEISGDRQFEGMLRKWVQGLVAIRVPGRGFREAPHYLGETGYVNGEAWLALAMYAEQYPNDEIFALLENLDHYLLARYAGKPTKQFYHWGSMAAARRSGMTGDHRFDDFLADLAGEFIVANESSLDLTLNTCHVVEGLASFVERAELVDPSGAGVARAKELIARLMEKNLQLQEFPNTKSRLHAKGAHPEPTEKYYGGFRRGMELPERVDYTAHCLNALVIMDRVKTGTDHEFNGVKFD